MNLVRNAIKFTRRGFIRIFVKFEWNPENLLSVWVEDSGIGIDQKDMHKLFTRFGKL